MTKHPEKIIIFFKKSETNVNLNRRKKIAKTLLKHRVLL